MVRLRCPRCSNIFPKPEGTPVCPFCSYAPRSVEPAAEPSTGPEVEVTAPVAGTEAVEAPPAAPTDDQVVAGAVVADQAAARKRTRAERKALKRARKQAAHDAKVAPHTAASDGKRHFFAKKKTGARVSAFLLTAFMTVLIGGCLPYAGRFINQGIDSEFNVASAHFAFVKDASTQSFGLYLTSTVVGVDMDQARLGEILLVAGMVVLFVAYVFALAKRPGIVLPIGLVAAGLIVYASITVQDAVSGFGGDLPPIGHFAVFGSLTQIVLALAFALFRALRRPQPTVE